jgi:hypothetical protein
MDCLDKKKKKKKRPGNEGSALAGLRIWSSEDCEFEKRRKLRKGPKGNSRVENVSLGILCLRNTKYQIIFYFLFIFLIHLSKKNLFF